MYLIDIAKIKTLFWMTDADNDYITEVWEITESYIHNFCNVKTFEQWEYVKEIELNEIALQIWRNNIIIDDYTNITNIIEINWELYTWIKWTDYFVKNKRNIIFKEMPKPNYFWIVELKIEAWYEDTSKEYKDIQNAANILFEHMHDTYKNSNEKFKTLQSISIWDISKSYNTNKMDSVVFESKNIIATINKILAKYKNLNVYSN